MARTTQTKVISQMSAMPERVAVVETKVDSMIVCIEGIKIDLKDLHDCLDITRDKVLAALKEQTDEYRIENNKFYEHVDKIEDKNTKQHDELYAKVNVLEKVKSKVTMYAIVFLAFAAGTGWLNGASFPHILKFFGI